MNKIFLVSIALFLNFTVISCKSTDDNETVETVEEPENLKREIKPGEMYHDITYHKNGQVKMEGNMIDEKKEGKWMAYYENGMPWSETFFENGLANGPTTAWHPNGLKFYEGAYKNGQRTGNWKFYNEDGMLEKEEDF